ncbi:hypothetical protein Pelo_2547, partial [Pelomyxa schiedti]
MAPVLLDNNFTRKVITLLNEFDEWNRIRANPQFGDHVSRIVGGLLKGVRELTILPGFGSRYESYLFDNAPFYIYMLLRLLEELDIGKIQDREAGLEILNEVASQICDSIFRSPSPDEAMVRAKDDTIVASLKVLQQDDPSLFDLILRLLSSRCSSAALLQRTFLTPQRELQLQILHLTLLFLKGIQNENQLVYTWNSFVQDQFFSRSSSILLVDFFNKPPVLYKQLSAKMPPQVSLSVLQGAVKLFEREIGGADRESAEATRDLVVKSVCSICPGGFSIPEGNTDVIRDLSKCYYDLLNLTCPSLRQGETGNAQRMGLWWYWLEWVTLAAGLEDLPQKQSLTAPFLERTLQYGLEAVRSTLSEDTLKFFDASVAHFFQTTPPCTFAELKQIPIKFLELQILRSVLERHANAWEPLQIGWVLDKYAQILVSRHNFDPQSGDPRVKFLPLRDLLYKSFRCSFINIVPFIRVSLYCPEYSNLFSFEDDRDIAVLKDIMKDVDVKPLSRQFTNTVRSLFQLEMEKLDQSQSPLFLLMLKTFGKSISAQLCALGDWVKPHLSRLSKKERESSIVIAVLMESVCPRCMMVVDEVMKLTPSVLSLFQLKDLNLEHPFFKNYETGCQEFYDTIQEQVDRICNKRVTLQEVKAFAGEQQLPIQSDTPNTPSKTSTGAPVRYQSGQQSHHHIAQTGRPSKMERTQYDQLVEICKELFPHVNLPDMGQVYCQFLKFKEQLHHLRIVRDWLEQKGRVHLGPVTADVNSETLCDLEQCCIELCQAIPLRDQPLNALKYFLVNDSAFFEFLFTDFARKNYGNKEVPPDSLEEILSAVTADLKQLQTGNLRLSQIRDIQKAAENRGIAAEFLIITQYFFELGDESSFDLEHFLQEGLTLFQYLDFIPPAVYCCKQFELCSETAKDLADLHHSLTTSQVSLKMCPLHFSKVKKQLEDILSHLLPLMGEQNRVAFSDKLRQQKTLCNALDEQAANHNREKECALTQLSVLLNTEKRDALEKQKIALEVEKEKALHQQRSELEAELQGALRKQELMLTTEKHNALEQQKKATELEKEISLQQQRKALEKMHSPLQQQESEFNTARNESLIMEMRALEHTYTIDAHNLEVAICGFQKGVMALAELNELDLTRATFIANGSFGTVCKVPVVLPKWLRSSGAHSAPTEVALKMMFNYSAGTRTLQLRTEFEREYEVSVINPHWCFTNVFNHFRGDSLITLIEESLRGNYTIVDSNRNWVSGCRDSRRAIAVYQRTTFMTMELGKCTLESLISSRIASIEQQTEEVLPTVPTSQQLQSMSPQNQHHPLCQSKDVLQLAFCVLCAVDHLNTRGWFHCDIKPDNILLMERPHIKGNIWALCDLGTAVFCEDGNPLVLPKGETFTGNAENRSPEVIQAEREFPLLKNDVWAVGCVLYEVVSGRHPFTNENQLHEVTSPNQSMDYIPFLGRLMGRPKGSTTGPDDAAAQLNALLGVAIKDGIGNYIASLPPEEPNLPSPLHSPLPDKNFTRQVITLLNEFDEWNKSKTNPQFGEHVSWIIGGLLTAVRELSFEKTLQKREEALNFLIEAASEVLDSIFHSPSPDETMVAEKDDVILTALRGLQQEDSSLFDLLVQLLGCRCSNVAILQSTYLTPKYELQLQILHLTLNFIKGIQNDHQLLYVYAWNNFVQEQFFPRSSPSLIVDFFNKPPVLYKQLSLKMSPMVSLSVLQGAVKLFERELRGADRESAEATCDIVVQNSYWICPGGFSIPKGNTDVIRELSKCYHDLLNLTCPSLRQGETGNAQRMGQWWYWLEWIALATTGLEDLGQRQSLTAPFLERTLQYGLEAVESTLINTSKFFGSSVTHFLQSSPPSSYIVFQQIPIKFLELEFLRSVLVNNAVVWEPLQIGCVLDKYAQKLVSRYNFNPESDDPRLKFLPLNDVFRKSFKSCFINIVPFIRISLYCPEYSTLFSFEDDHDVGLLRDIMKDVDVKPLIQQFPSTVRWLLQCEAEKLDQIQSPLFLLMLKTFASLLVSIKTPPEKPISTQLCTLGEWLKLHLSSFSKQERESSIVIAVLMESVCPRCMMAVDEVMKLTPSVLSLFQCKDLNLEHPFFGNYEQGCQQLCETIKEQVDRIFNKLVTLQEVKAFAGEQQLPTIATQSNTPNTPSKTSAGPPVRDQQSHHHIAQTGMSSKKEPTGESTQYAQLVEIGKALFPNVNLPDMGQVYCQFLEVKEQLHHLHVVRDWLEQKGRVHIGPVTSDVNRETLCGVEQCCIELRQAIPLRDQPFNSLKYFLVNGSAFFEFWFIDFTKKNYGNKEVPPDNLEEILSAVTADLRQLQTGNLRLNQIRDIQKAAENRGIATEFRIITQYFSELGYDPSFDLEHYLQEGLTLFQYLDFIPPAVYCCKQYDLCSETAKDLADLHHSLTTSQVSLKLCPLHFSKVQKQ